MQQILRLIVWLISLALVIIGAFFASIIFVVIGIIGILTFLIVGWTVRRNMKTMVFKEFSPENPGMDTPSGDIIEGEYHEVKPDEKADKH